MSDALARFQAGELDLEKIAAWLAECVDVDALRDIHDRVRAIEMYQRRRGASLSAQQDAAEIALRAERRLGELCAKVTPKSRGGRPKKTGSSVLPVSLADLGVSKIQSSRWQKVNAIPKRDFDAHVTLVRARGERLTTSGALRATSDLEDYDSDEWYTPARYIEAAREVMGGIDLDPASSKVAQKRIGADEYFTKGDDGLAYEWHGRVWLNPPYSQPAATDFADQLLEEYEAGRVTAAVMVQNSGTDTAWFHRMAAAAHICLVKGRINFDRADGESAANRYAQVFFYLGPKPKLFERVFGRFGLVGRLRSTS